MLTLGHSHNHNSARLPLGDTFSVTFPPVRQELELGTLISQTFASRSTANERPFQNQIQEAGQQGAEATGGEERGPVSLTGGRCTRASGFPASSCENGFGAADISHAFRESHVFLFPEIQGWLYLIHAS